MGVLLSWKGGRGLKGEEEEGDEKESEGEERVCEGVREGWGEEGV